MDSLRTPDPHLVALLATHAAALQKLLPPPLWPLAPIEVKHYGLLTKYVLGEARPGIWAMLHRLDGSDASACPHNHPCRFDSYGIKGGYWEHSHHEDGRTELTLRVAGGHYTIWPHTIHEVVAVLDGPAWTLVFAGPVVSDWKHFPELSARSK